jgi:hypothetical protein
MKPELARIKVGSHSLTEAEWSALARNPNALHELAKFYWSRWKDFDDEEDRKTSQRLYSQLKRLQRRLSRRIPR